MNKKILAAALSVAMLLLSGCQLALPEAAASAQPDRLVGVYITTDYLDLFDIEAYLQDHIGDIAAGGEVVIDDGSAYGGRIYAELVEKTFLDSMGDEQISHSYEFPELGGMLLAYFKMEPTGVWAEGTTAYWRSDSDSGLCNIENHCAIGDTSTVLNQTATIYVPTGSGETIFFFNPVFQTADGQVYLVSGGGVSTSSERVSTMSHSLNDSYTYTIDGMEYSFQSDIEVTVEIINIPEKVVLIQMDENHRELRRDEYIPGQMPEYLTPEADTAYILVEEYCGGEVQRSLCSQDSNFVSSFYNMGNNICIPDYTHIEWPEET